MGLIRSKGDQALSENYSANEKEVGSSKRTSTADFLPTITMLKTLLLRSQFSTQRKKDFRPKDKFLLNILLIIEE